ncbi:MAG: DUF2849 domain-containing protein [Pseudomonadota bacterium]
MAKKFTPKVLTASRLLEGDVVYFDGTKWVSLLAEAKLFEHEDAAEAALAQAKARPDLFVGPYLTDAKVGPSGVEPLHFREAFRTTGPSNYAHGKQAEH